MLKKKRRKIWKKIKCVKEIKFLKKKCKKKREKKSKNITPEILKKNVSIENNLKLNSKHITNKYLKLFCGLFLGLKQQH